MTLSRGKKWALSALAVLAVGAGMLFHHSPMPPTQVEGEARRALTRRIPSPRGTGERGQLLQSFEEIVPRVPVAATTVDPDTGSRDFAAHPSGPFHPGRALFEPSDNLPPAQPSGDELLADAGDHVAAAPTPPRTHLVVDGDTLARLAARYFGSSDRYGEIFAANRPLLTKPDLLPIGTRLVIPPRQRPAPAVELSPEDYPGASRLGEDEMPRLDFDPLAAPGTNQPGTNPSATRPSE